MDREAGWARVYEVEKSQTPPRQLSMHAKDIKFVLSTFILLCKQPLEACKTENLYH